LLAPVDRVHGVAEVRAMPSLDLYEGHDISISNDEIDLTKPASVTLGQDPTTL